MKCRYYSDINCPCGECDDQKAEAAAESYIMGETD